MTTRLHRLFAALVIAVNVVVLPVPPAHADPANCVGVLVVVDATATSGDVVARCADGTPRTGLDALTQAGFEFTFVPRIPGLVCQIDRQPDPCNNASADAYWSYWHRAPNGAWRYSTEGAGTRRPTAGSWEGWVFGTGSHPPNITPIASSGQPAPPPVNASSPNVINNSKTSTEVPPTNAANQSPIMEKDANSPTELPNTQLSDPLSETDNNEENAATSLGFLDRFREEPRQLVGLLLVIIGVAALISAQRNRAKRLPQ